jgi:uncharacterized membrane protein
MSEFLPFIAVGLVIAVGLFLFLRNREKRRAEAGQPALANWRLLLATVAAMVALFSGGCSLVFAGGFPNDSGVLHVVFLIGVLPCLVAIFVFWLSMRRKQQ